MLLSFAVLVGLQCQVPLHEPRVRILNSTTPLDWGMVSDDHELTVPEKVFEAVIEWPVSFAQSRCSYIQLSRACSLEKKKIAPMRGCLGSTPLPAPCPRCPCVQLKWVVGKGAYRTVLLHREVQVSWKASLASRVQLSCWVPQPFPERRSVRGLTLTEKNRMNRR